jgi:hypothetical protein
MRDSGGHAGDTHSHRTLPDLVFSLPTVAQGFGKLGFRLGVLFKFPQPPLALKVNR